MFTKTKHILCFIFIIFLTSCTLKPDPISELTRWEQAQKDLRKLYAGQDKVDGPVDLYEAVARALLYNYDYRVKLFEKALAMDQFSLAKYDLLPDLVAKLGYHNRSKFAGGRSFNLFTGDINDFDNATASQERDRFLGDLELTWNVLDFGISYYTARQRGRDILRAYEQKRRTFQNIYREVISAYWRAVSAEAMIKDITSLKKQVNTALYRARQVEKERIDSPLKSLGYQRNLLEIMRNLNSLLRNLQPAKMELATLMGLPLSTEYQLYDAKKRTYKVKKLDIPVEKLEQIALMQRPELYEIDYQEQNGGDEIIKSYLRLLPQFNVTVGERYDTNFFTVNKQFRTAVVESTLNLFQLLAGPATFDVLRSQGLVLEAQRLALTAAVIAQVNLSVERYKMAAEDYDIALQTMQVSSRIFKQVKNREVTDADDQQQLILAAANDLISRVQYYVAYTELQNAMTAIGDSVGRDVVPFLQTNGLTLDQLAKRIKIRSDQWNENKTYNTIYNKLTKMKSKKSKMEGEKKGPKAIKRRIHF